MGWVCGGRPRGAVEGCAAPALFPDLPPQPSSQLACGACSARPCSRSSRSCSLHTSVSASCSPADTAAPSGRGAAADAAPRAKKPARSAGPSRLGRTRWAGANWRSAAACACSRASNAARSGRRPSSCAPWYSAAAASCAQSGGSSEGGGVAGVGPGAAGSAGMQQRSDVLRAWCVRSQQHSPTHLCSQVAANDGLQQRVGWRRRWCGGGGRPAL